MITLLGIVAFIAVLAYPYIRATQPRKKSLRRPISAIDAELFSDALPVGRIGTDGRQPGDGFGQVTERAEVVGLSSCKDNVIAFAKAVQAAAPQSYGLALEPDSGNEQAIKVMGWAETDGDRKTWHIGFVPRDKAVQLSEGYVTKGVALGAHLYQIYCGQDEYFEIEFHAAARN